MQTYTITQNDINTGRVNNTASVTVTYAGTPYSDTASATVPAAQNPQIRITKTASERNYTSAGEVIHYTLTVTNAGNVTLTGVVVTDPNATVTCANSPYTLAPGDQRTCTAVHTVTGADVTAGSIRNVATATGYDPGMNRVTASSNAVTVSLNNMASVYYLSETDCD